MNFNKQSCNHHIHDLEHFDQHIMLLMLLEMLFLIFNVLIIYGNTIDFYILTLNPLTMLNSLILADILKLFGINYISNDSLPHFLVPVTSLISIT